MTSPATPPPDCPAPPDNSVACRETFTHRERWGYLWAFREQFREIHRILNDWVNERDEAGVSFTYDGGNCFETWCLPNAACVMLSNDEKIGYDINPATNTYNAGANAQAEAV
ncbi:hypothetical protein EOM89_14555, partial [Candidatus Falkowbacteria bacterium]|nr:hypothetical protein [Candidatus Falkowbacteria bacterium]